MILSNSGTISKLDETLFWKKSYYNINNDCNAAFSCIVNITNVYKKNLKDKKGTII